MPCNKTITAIQTADLLVKDVFKHFGLPDSIISDNHIHADKRNSGLGVF